jgi:predicted transcriptional regulator
MNISYFEEPFDLDGEELLARLSELAELIDPMPPSVAETAIAAFATRVTANVTASNRPKLRPAE